MRSLFKIQLFYYLYYHGGHSTSSYSIIALHPHQQVELVTTELIVVQRDGNKLTTELFLIIHCIYKPWGNLQQIIIYPINNQRSELEEEVDNYLSLCHLN